MHDIQPRGEGIGLPEVERHRHDLVAQGPHGEDRCDATGRTQQVAGPDLSDEILTTLRQHPATTWHIDE